MKNRSVLLGPQNKKLHAYTLEIGEGISMDSIKKGGMKPPSKFIVLEVNPVMTNESTHHESYQY